MGEAGAKLAEEYKGARRSLKVIGTSKEKRACMNVDVGTAVGHLLRSKLPVARHRTFNFQCAYLLPESG